jgi:hypothetical protein
MKRLSNTKKEHKTLGVAVKMRTLHRHIQVRNVTSRANLLGRTVSNRKPVPTVDNAAELLRNFSNSISAHLVTRDYKLPETIPCLTSKVFLVLN